MLIGHERRWAALARAFGKGKMPHTLLVSGPPHVGKSAFVLRYARLLLCPNVAPDAQGLPAPCGECRVCHQVEIETYPDYRVFRPIVGEADEKDWVIASEFLDSSIITVKVARRFTDEAMLKPLNPPRKVLWMAQVDRMNESAQNALLKTFEEPPAGTFIVLTTDNPKRLRETILSRCWHLQLTPAPDAEIEAWLRPQFPGATPAQMTEALRAAAGRPGAAWRELEQATNQEGERTSRFALAADMLERMDRAQPVGALGFTEEALKLAKLWWEEDAGDSADAKKAAAKANRAAAARFLDELMQAGRSRWAQNPAEGAAMAARLDLMRKTRHYILRNANTNLALDVMFGRLIALRPRNEPVSRNSAGRGRN